MSAEIGSGQVWIMADELPAMEYQPQIEQLVTRGRKRGLAVVMGFQNVSQLRSIWAGRRHHPDQFAHYQGHLTLRRS